MSRFYTNPAAQQRSAPYSCAACSPDGRLLAVVEEKTTTIRLIEVASGQVRAEFSGHRDGIHALAFAPDGKTLASGGEDNMVLLWDVVGPSSTALAANLPARWAELAADAKQASLALAAFLLTPEQSVAFLQKRLRPAQPPDWKRLAAWLAELDTSSFAKRAAAEQTLAQLGEPIELFLRQTLKDASVEKKLRLERVLDAIAKMPLSAETLQAIRAVEVLEHIGTPATRQVLRTLAQGDPNMVGWWPRQATAHSR